MKQSNAIANISACIAAVLFGASVVAVRVAVQDVPPLTVAFLRFGQGSICLFLALGLFRRDLLRVDRRDIGFIALLGALFYTIFPTTFNIGLRYTEASRAALLVATMPLWTLVLARTLTRERLTKRQIAGVLISIAGVAVVILGRGGAGGSFKGDALLLTTALCGAIYNVLAKRVLSRNGAIAVSAYAMLFGTLLLVPIALTEHSVAGVLALRGQALWLVLFLGILGGALAFTLWTSALTHLTPTQVAVYINLNPMSATLLAATALGERLSPLFLAGFVAVIAGVTIVNRPARSEITSS